MSYHQIAIYSEAFALVRTLLEDEEDEVRIPKKLQPKSLTWNPFANLAITPEMEEKARQDRAAYLQRHYGIGREKKEIPTATALPTTAPSVQSVPPKETPFDPKNPKVDIVTHGGDGQPERVSALYLQPPYTWQLWGPKRLHWREQLLNDKRILPEDREAIRAKMFEMFREPNKILVPSTGSWALKMPRGYCLLGSGGEGATWTIKFQKPGGNRLLVENPFMNTQERRDWEKGRTSL